jgi:hypothetical protein
MSLKPVSLTHHVFLSIHISVTFYQTYPVSDQPVRELTVMKEEQLPSYAPPPVEACVLPPTMPPTPEPTKSPTVKAASSPEDAQPTINLPSPEGFQPSPNGPVPAPYSPAGTTGDATSRSATLVAQQWTVQTTAVIAIVGALVLVL